MRSPTLIIAIQDESGSMDTKKADVIGGFNQFLASQKEMDDPCRFILVKFNTECSVVHEAIPIQDVAPLTEKTYTPGGNTALFDAVAQGVYVADRLKRPEERVLCLIMTDGEENSSRETGLERLISIIRSREQEGSWTFTYLGVSPDHWARMTGMAAANVAAYEAGDPRASYLALSRSAAAFRRSGHRRTDTFHKA